ncbi:SurA N-terminal domain-containing protein [Saccharophagus degradans]|uniref:SurA N-terminal domain-containing protein n=1 Tax=Saccharophagus degradans TaxID=86304 RepID=UPI001C098AFF|nr:SurA N-terminal domain-containing protein [Saccharophagus degradans]MBU2984023.1 SurA N-terminal domain-containing protein [Saccharophagus degradans]
MLQNVRDNLKNKVVFGIVVLVMLIMVVGGVGSVNLNSIGGNDVASVGGEGVSAVELGRAVAMRKDQLLANGVDPTSDFVKEQNLRQQILPQLVRRKALLVTAEEAGVGAAVAEVEKAILGQEAFKVGGKFDPQTYRRLIGNAGYLPATYKVAVAEDIILSHQSSGLAGSAFVSDEEINALVAILNQKRSFFGITIPKETVGDEVTVTPEQIEAYYQANQQEFSVPAKVSVDYIEISVAEIAKTIAVDEADIKAQYEQEKADFVESSEYEIAHILIADGDESASKIEEVQTQLAAGEAFETLAETYSDDFGSRETGGSLGVLTPGIFPEEFEQAVYALEEGEVSEPVATDAGTHFIKVTSKKVEALASYEERKPEIKKAIQNLRAESFYVDQYAELEELTFNAGDLTVAADQLGLTVKQSPLFERNFGNGVAKEVKVRNAAFSEDVLLSGRNSPVIEISNSKAMVLRKRSHNPEHIAALELVSSQIQQKLQAQAVQAKLAELAKNIQSEIAAGKSPKEVAESLGYDIAEHELVKRMDVTADAQMLRAVFQMPAGSGATVFEDIEAQGGNRVLLGLTAVQPGKVEDMTEQERAALSTQLLRENANLEIAAYEEAAISKVKVKY